MRPARVILLALTVLLPGFVVAATESRRTILLVFDETPVLPGLAVIDRTLRATFNAELEGDLEFCSESLGLSQFKDPGYEDLLRGYFIRKYAGKTPDLIVAVMQPSLDFLLHDRQALFPGVPIVFCGIDSSYLETHPLPLDVTGLAIRRNYAHTLDLALRLQPGMRNLFVVGGTAAFDRQIQAIARRNLAPYETRVRITYLTELPMPDLLDQVAKLPDQSALYFLSLFRDGDGHAFIPHDALARIAAVANAPVYVAVDQFLDFGAVGGHVYSVASHGRQTAELGVRLLRSPRTPAVAVSDDAAYSNIFDWGQLQRWGLDATRLPPGTELRHRTSSVWESYRGYIIVGVVFAALQTALIVALLVSRVQRRRAEARRRLAEEELQRQRDELAHAQRLTALGELTASLAHEIGQPLAAILINAQAVHRQAINQTLPPGALDEALTDIENDVQRATETIESVRALYKKQPSERKPLDLDELIKDVMRLLRADLMGKHIQVSFQSSGSLPKVLGDAVQLRQVLINLLMNAKDAISRETHHHREIRIETQSPREDTVAVVIRDTGAGVKEGDLEWMFDRFASTKTHGLGMGLTISRSIVTAHHGRIWATRNDDHGLSLHVEIPTAGGAVAS